MVRVAKANLRHIETLRRMKPDRHKTIRVKRAKDAMTPPISNDSPTSPNQGVNVDNSVRDNSPHQLTGDVIVLASTSTSTSTHVADMTSSPTKKPRVKMMANKKMFVKRTYIYKSPFVEGCAKQFERITKPKRLVANYVFDVNGAKRHFRP